MRARSQQSSQERAQASRTARTVARYAAVLGDDDRAQRYLDEAHEHERGLSSEVLADVYGQDVRMQDASTPDELRQYDEARRESRRARR